MKIKSILAVLGGCSVLAGVQAQDVGHVIPFQGQLADQAGQPLVPTAPVPLVFRLYNQAVGGAAIWEEPHTNISVIAGRFSVLLGSRAALPGETNFNRTLYLGITVDDGNAATADVEMRPRQALVPVVSAKYAQNADKLDGFDWRSLLVSGNDPSTGKIAGSKIDPAGSFTAAHFGPDVGVWARSGSNVFYNTGSVGIGTDNPQTALDVNGKLYVSENGTLFYLVGRDHGYIAYYPDGADAGRKGYVGFGSPNLDHFTIANEAPSGDIHLLPAAGRAVYVSGSVGIGTATPATPLHVVGPATISNSGDGAVLMYLDIERSWQLRQLGSGSSTSLELASVGGNGSKDFTVTTTARVVANGGSFLATADGQTGRPGQYGRDNSIVAWGRVFADGTSNVTNKYGVSLTEKTGTGTYRVTIHALMASKDALVPCVTPFTSGEPRWATFQPDTADRFIVRIWEGVGSGGWALKDTDFAFIVTGR